MKKLFLFFFFLTTFFSQENLLDKDIYLEKSLQEINYEKINIFYFFSEDGQIHKGEKLSFIPIFNFPKTISGNKQKINWGIDCQKENSNCEFTSEKINQTNFNKKMFFYQNALNFFRIQKNEIEILKKKKMKIELINSGNNPYEKNTIIGLSPNSDSNNYFKNLYNNKFSFLISYQIKEGFENKEKLIFESNFIINPNFEEKNIFEEFEIEKNSENWILEGSVFLHEIFGFEKKKICFSNFENDLFISNDFLNFCEDIQKIACDGKIGNQCKFDNSDFTKIKNLKFNFGNSEIEFFPEEFLFFDENKNLKCRFGNFNNLKENGLCENSDELAVGKIFYSKLFPVFKFENEKTFLIFLKNYDFLKKIDKLTFYLIIGGISLVILVFLFLIIFKLLKSKKGIDLDFEENYTKI